MENKLPVFINPFTDFGFKKIFGEEQNKDLLRFFLNELLLTQNQHIKKLKFKKNDKLGNSDLDRKVVFDIYCENEKGEKFTVELQKAKQEFFKDRMLYYSSYSVQEQGIKGDWNYKLKHVYVIAILDFIIDESDSEKIVVTRSKLMDIERFKVFYEKLTFITLQMPNFTKKETELKTNFEKWLFIIKNLHKLDEVPKKFQSKIFKKLFSVASYSALNKQEREQYEESLKYYNDLKNSLDTSKEEGREEIRQELLPKLEEANQKIVDANQKLKESVRAMKQFGIPIELIINTTGLTKEEIEKM